MKRRRAVAALAALAFLPLTACGDDSSAGSGSDGEMTIRLGFAGAVLSPGAAMYTSLPEVLGFWGEDNLKVEITRIEGTAVALSAMVGNQIDVAVVSGEAVVPPISEGQPFVIPYSLSQRGIVATAVPADSPINGLGDLGGKTVGVPNLATGAVTFTKAGAAEAGVDPNSIKFVAIGTGAQAANAIKSGQVDAVSDTDTSVVGFQQAGADLKVLDSAINDKLVIGVVAATTKSIMADKKAELEAWARGVAKATEWMQANPEEAVKAHYRKFPETRPSGEDGTVIAAGVAQVTARLQSIKAADNGEYGSIRNDQLEYIIQYLTENGQIKQSVEVSAIYDGSLIAGVNAFDKAAVRAVTAPS
ncbi:ABC transporter substrate-binding protein [Micromonospora craniellae]|uniref:ABC transporter substrate-binding protein n=1 Tax=Micromonospora craniellae TaxID=2294034 RepID=A0A372G2Z1_9ACTN|nr:ABC transporter substrate-binding protein [Micromonospora craniellae]QOC92125.1 ABC transporter substrate-binding protein [Micromonospora craniellae]RFS47417.1 ABC transporter substrate-binding protein [Micromonospora craniellae]